jgi:3-isopropylmalate dehydratase small subunit
LALALPALALAELAGRTTLTIDLTRQEIRADETAPQAFTVTPWRRRALLNGWDEVTTLINTKAETITAFETARRAAAPWLFTAG